jgi:lipoprotein-anchoring transpeptidase ErfK/SrfK
MMPALVAGTVLTAGFFLLWRVLLPFGVTMEPPDGTETVNPRAPVTVRALGFGTLLTDIEVCDETGAIVVKTGNQTSFSLESPLPFGKRYTIAVTAERSWFHQRESKTFRFATVAIPRLEVPRNRDLGPDASFTLEFDRPVGAIEAQGDLLLTLSADEHRRTFHFRASHYDQGRTYPVSIHWQTATGVPLPPFELQVTTPPAVIADSNLRDATNLGLAMPLEFTFSEPLAERNQVGSQIHVHARGGPEIKGQWKWIGKTRLRFTPDGGWPPTSTIVVSADSGQIRSPRGGFLDPPLEFAFNTGTDRHIYVHLDTQRLVAVENGQVVRSFKVSTGKAATPTVAGSFYIYARFPVKTMKSKAKPGEKGHYVVENVPYAQYFYEDYALHGAWWHNAFGQPASHGCINIATRTNNHRWPNVPENAGWLYQWASLGVPVTVYPVTPDHPNRLAQK